MRILPVAFLATLMIGCATNQRVDYDPNEMIVHGKVVGKTVLKNPLKYEIAEREAAAERTNFAIHQANALGVDPVAARAAVVLLNAIGFNPGDAPTVDGNPYTYEVVAMKGQRYEVLSYFGGFEEGDCVKLFIGSDPQKYPARMAHGHECHG